MNDETTKYAVISETRGLVSLVEGKAAADARALTVAVNTGRTVYVKPASEVR